MYNIDNITNTIICGDSLEELKKIPEESIDCVVTSPPYWKLRQYLFDKIKLKENCPDFVKEELKKLNIFPINI